MWSIAVLVICLAAPVWSAKQKRKKIKRDIHHIKSGMTVKTIAQIPAPSRSLDEWVKLSKESLIFQCDALRLVNSGSCSDLTCRLYTHSHTDSPNKDTPSLSGSVPGAEDLADPVSVPSSFRLCHQLQCYLPVCQLCRPIIKTFQGYS